MPVVLISRFCAALAALRLAAAFRSVPSFAFPGKGFGTARKDRRARTWAPRLQVPGFELPQKTAPQAPAFELLEKTELPEKTAASEAPPFQLPQDEPEKPKKRKKVKNAKGSGVAKEQKAAGGFGAAKPTGSGDAKTKLTPYERRKADKASKSVAPRGMKRKAGPSGATMAKDVANKIVEGLDEDGDMFWQLIPPVLLTDPVLGRGDIQRVLALSEIVQNKSLSKFRDKDAGWRSLVADEWRPHEEMHLFMPGIHPASSFHDASTFGFARELEANYAAIRDEFTALRDSGRADFQSVTGMNYKAGWKTLVLRFNGGRLKGFPYELCPVTERILSKVPVAGRIVGFNRQHPGTGIPLHSDGNNMWLTLQMGISLPAKPPPLPDPDDDPLGLAGKSNVIAPPEGVRVKTVPDTTRPWIRVGYEARHWEEGKCMVYDTTYEHETWNPNPYEERVVLHVDFWNAVSTRADADARAAASAAGALSDVELAAMQKVYNLREQFLGAEGDEQVERQQLGPDAPRPEPSFGFSF